MTTDLESNIINLDSYRGMKKSLPKQGSRIVRISSELDGMEALYSSDLSPEHLFSVKILFWALLDNGEAYAVIPWLEDTITTENNRSLEGSWQGYFDASQDRIFFKPPKHKQQELKLAHQFYETRASHNEKSKTTKLEVTPQQLPDHLGTHAAFKKTNEKGFYLKPVISWQLTQDGDLQAMVPKVDDPNIQPIIGSDDELMAANTHAEFRYYFQHGIAKRIKHQDPNALTVVSLLIDLV